MLLTQTKEMATKEKPTIISLFSGCGGLDLGFVKAGFNLIYANDNDKDVWETFEKNHKIKLDKRSIVDISSKDLPDADGIIGGPPCQSWSLAGAMRGTNDSRGKLFYDYLRILADKKPKFFLVENVPGLISKTHVNEFNKILEEFNKIGYNISYSVVNAKDFGIPQERKRVLVIGYRKDLRISFSFPQFNNKKSSLRDAIGDLPNSILYVDKTNANLKIANHEHMNGGFSTRYLSRNRKRNWSESSFTIQASGRHAPLHPNSTRMIKEEKDKWYFKDGIRSNYRRLSVRECARIQTFPDNFIFYYGNVAKGYKMIGNAVPVMLAEKIAKKIRLDLEAN